MLIKKTILLIAACLLFVGTGHANFAVAVMLGMGVSIITIALRKRGKLIRQQLEAIETVISQIGRAHV